MDADAVNSPIKYIGLDTWAGRRYYAVEVVGETPKKVRVRILTPGGVMLPGRRYVPCDGIVLVPKYSLFDRMVERYKVEEGYYDGNVFGYGGTIDEK